MQSVRILKRPSDEEQRKKELDEAILKDLKLSHVARFVSTMDSLDPGWKSDATLRVKTQEVLSEAMFPGESSRTSISAIAKEMGVALDREQLIKVGAMVARLYREKNHSTPPKKSLQWADGVDRKVNVYTDEDRGLIETALMATCRPAGAAYQ